jgi:hypothetical protein
MKEKTEIKESAIANCKMQISNLQFAFCNLKFPCFIHPSSFIVLSGAGRPEAFSMVETVRERGEFHIIQQTRRRNKHEK